MEKSIDKHDKVTFEGSILSAISPMGKFQWRVMAWGSAIDIPAAFCVMFFIFAGANPGFACTDEEEAENSTQLSDFEFNSTCEVNGTRCASRLFNTREFTSIVTEWDLVCEKQIYNTYISTALMLGLFLGASVFGHLADMYGRKIVIFPVVACMMLSHVLTTFVYAWPLLVCIRFAVGFFAGGMLVVNFIIPLEITNSYWRGICVTLSGWAVGTMLLVLFAYFIRDWRQLALVTGLSGFPIILCWWIVPESPRWLIQEGRFDEAKAVLKWMARVNRRPEPDYTLLPAIAQAYHADAAKEKKYTFLDLFRSRQLTRYISVLALFWFTSASSFYGIAMNAKELNGNRYINAIILACLEQVFNLSIMVTTRFFGRKQVASGYMLVGALCLMVMLVAGLLPSGTITYVQTGFGLLGRAAISGAWCMAYLLCAELFPTLLRNTASGVCSMAGRVGGVAAPYIAHLYFVHPSIPHAVFCFLALATGLAIIVFIPETKGRPLPDIMPDQPIPLCACCSNAPNIEDADESESFTMTKTNGN